MKKILIAISVILSLSGIVLLIYSLYNCGVNYDTIGEGFSKGWPLIMMSAGLILLGITFYKFYTYYKQE